MTTTIMTMLTLLLTLLEELGTVPWAMIGLGLVGAVGAIIAGQKIISAGLNPTFAAAAAGGDSFSNSGNEYVHFKQAAGNTTNVTFVAQGLCSHGFTHNVIINIPASGERKIGPFRDTARWNDANQRVNMTYDQVVGLTVGVFTD